MRKLLKVPKPMWWNCGLSRTSFPDVSLTTLDGCGRRVVGHRVLLASVSSKLSSLMVRNVEEGRVVLVRNIQFSHLEAVVDFLYTGSVSVDDAGKFTNEDLDDALILLRVNREILDIVGEARREVGEEEEETIVDMVTEGSEESSKSSDKRMNVNVLIERLKCKESVDYEDEMLNDCTTINSKVHSAKVKDLNEATEHSFDVENSFETITSNSDKIGGAPGELSKLAEDRSRKSAFNSTDFKLKIKLKNDSASSAHEPSKKTDLRHRKIVCIYCNEKVVYRKLTGHCKKNHPESPYNDHVKCAHCKNRVTVRKICLAFHNNLIHPELVTTENVMNDSRNINSEISTVEVEDENVAMEPLESYETLPSNGIEIDYGNGEHFNMTEDESSTSTNAESKPLSSAEIGLTKIDCMYCNTKVNYNKFTRHCKRHHPSNIRETVGCLHCPNGKRVKIDCLAFHNKHLHPVLKFIEGKREVDAVGRNNSYILCDFCPSRKVKYSRYRKHCEVLHPEAAYREKIKCDICGFKVSLVALHHHMKLYHKVAPVKNEPYVIKEVKSLTEESRGDPPEEETNWVMGQQELLKKAEHEQSDIQEDNKFTISNVDETVVLDKNANNFQPEPAAPPSEPLIEDEKLCRINFSSEGIIRSYRCRNPNLSLRVLLNRYTNTLHNSSLDKEKLVFSCEEVVLTGAELVGSLHNKMINVM